MRDALTDRLIELFENTATDDWPWFEKVLSYDNAKLPHALIASRPRSGGNPRALDVGLQALRWLVKQQKSPSGYFRPIGSNGFYRTGRTRPVRPAAIEAHATVSACLEAYHATEDPAWLQEARLAFEWFLGGNDLGSTSTTPRPAAAATAFRKTAST